MSGNLSETFAVAGFQAAGISAGIKASKPTPIACF